jgi:hypothetical protein
MMSIPENIDLRVWTLANAVCEGTITEQEVQELESLLKADRNALLFYVDFLRINAEILWLVSVKPHSTMDSGTQAPTAPIVPHSDRSPVLGFLGDWANFINHHSPLSFMLLFVILGAALLVTSYWLSTPQSDKSTARSDFVAQITVAKNCQWSTAITPPTEMMQLQVGQHLQLEKGMVQITYSKRALVLLEGPVSFTVDSPNSGFLSQGKLTARANTEKSRQFTIATPDARFVDLGTEFGVMIDAQGRAAVAVFEGKVNAEAKLANGRWTAPISLRKGEAAICEGTKFTPHVAQRSDFPMLQTLPPPPLDPSYQRWLDANRELQARQDLVAYYDFQPDPNNSKVLLNRAPTGASYNGEIQNAAWVEGRFPGKKALTFLATDAGVRVNFPGEFKQMTVIAWVNNKRLANKYNGILMSDSWDQPKKLHFQIQNSGQMIMHVCGQLTTRANGKDNYCSTEAIPPGYLDRWCMIAGVIDTPDHSSLYLNGEYFEKLESTQMPAIQIGSAMIGGWDKGNSKDLDVIRNFSGQIDELMIFQNALTAENIKQIYEAGKP